MMFGFGKKKEEAPSSACACNGKAETYEAEAPACGCGRDCAAEGKVQGVKVLGSGCKNCHTLLENTQTAVKSMGLAVDVEYVTDLQKVMAYGVMSMPALVVNEQVASTGKVLKPDEVEKLFHKLGY